MSSVLRPALAAILSLSCAGGLPQGYPHPLVQQTRDVTQLYPGPARSDADVAVIIINTQLSPRARSLVIGIKNDHGQHWRIREPVLTRGVMTFEVTKLDDVIEVVPGAYEVTFMTSLGGAWRERKTQLVALPGEYYVPLSDSLAPLPSEYFRRFGRDDIRLVSDSPGWMRDRDREYLLPWDPNPSSSRAVTVQIGNTTSDRSRTVTMIGWRTMQLGHHDKADMRRAISFVSSCVDVTDGERCEYEGIHYYTEREDRSALDSPRTLTVLYNRAGLLVGIVEPNGG